MVVAVVVVVVVVVGTGTVQSVERFGYELEDERLAINFLRPIPALSITEPPIRQVICQSLRARPPQRNWKLQRNCNFRNVTDFKQATGFQISRLTLRKLTFD
jgi:hypothetical protein